MQSYTISYNAEFYDDLISSFEWGEKYWDAEMATNWADGVFHAIETILTRLPLGCPIAPENKLVHDFEVRHLIVGRYRVLFTIIDSEVKILRLKGPFSGQNK